MWVRPHCTEGRKTPKKAHFAIKQTNICRLSGDIISLHDCVGSAVSDSSSKKSTRTQVYTSTSHRKQNPSSTRQRYRVTYVTIRRHKGVSISISTSIVLVWIPPILHICLSFDDGLHSTTHIINYLLVIYSLLCSTIISVQHVE